MKQKFLVCLTMVLLLTLGLMGAALADNAVVVPEVQVVLSQNRFSGPGPVDVTVTVSNKAATNMPGPCALYDPDGVRIAAFGQPTLKAGESTVWSGTWNVTEKQLGDGKIVFVLAYTYLNSEGTLDQKTQPISVPIVNAGLEAKLEVSRSITPTTARKDQKVYVTYTIANVGGLDVKDVTIKESSAISSSAANIGEVKVGETKTYTFTVTMQKKNLTSRATVTYKAGTESGSVAVEDATIKYSDVKLSAKLTADKKGGLVGDVVKLTLTLKNAGKKDIGNITVTDPVLGTLFSGKSVAANDSLVLEKEITITSSADLLLTVSGSDSSGNVITTATEMVKVIAVDPSMEATLSVTAETDAATIYTTPGIVKFTIHVTNTSNATATNVKVVSAGVTVYPYNTSSSGATLAPGETISFVRDVRVDTPGTFRFDATTRNQLGETVTFEGNGIRVKYARPTATPTMAPISTPVAPVTEPIPQEVTLPAEYTTAESVLKIVFYAMVGLAVLALALIVIGIIGRSSKNSHSNNAADVITRASMDDYTVSVSNRRRHYMPESEDDGDSANAPGADETQYMSVEPEIPAPVAEDSSEADALAASMQAAMTELYPEAAAPQEEESQDPDAYAETVVYGEPEFPCAEPVEQPAPEAPVEQEAPAEPEAPVVPSGIPAGIISGIPDGIVAGVTEGTYRRRRRNNQDEQ